MPVWIPRSAAGDSGGFSGGGGAGGAGAGGSGGSVNVAGWLSGGGGSSGATAVRPTPNVSGRWGMYTDDTDYVVAELDQNNGTLTGLGCYNGFLLTEQDEEEFLASDCGEITGSIVDNHVQFEFLAHPTGAMLYEADLLVDEHAQRMTGITLQGDVGNGLSVWLRAPMDEFWLTSDFEWPAEVIRDWYTLDLSPVPPLATVTDPAYVVGESYRLKVDDRGAIAGDLGAFWGSEFTMTVQGDDLLINVGPVPVTSPDLPMALQLRFMTGVLTTVEATTPDGARYSFTAQPAPR